MATNTISHFHKLLMLLLIIFWGSSFVVVKIALNQGLTPVGIATFRFLIAGVLFMGVLMVNKTRKPHCQLLVDRKDVPTLLILALTGVTLFFTAQCTGIQMANASIAAIFVCLLSPIIITILSTLLFQEHLIKNQMLGIGIAAAGTFTVIVGGAPSLSGSREFFLGSLILLSTPFLWAAYSLLGKRITEKYDPFLVTAYVTGLGGLCLIPFSLAEGSLHQIRTMTATGWMPILFLSITCSLLGYYIWLYVLNQIGAAATSSFLFAEPLVTVIFAVTLVGEELTIFILAGGMLTFVGVYLLTTHRTDYP